MNMPTEPTYHTFTLPNGLRVIHAPSASRVTYCGFAVDAGTRDEEEREPGLAHFVEHLLFKGTRKRRAWHILNRMENVGGDLNAYTGKEETVVYSAFLAEHFARATELMADIVFRSTFPQHEVEKEAEVVIDEIRSYEDTPSELIFDDFEGLLFPGHPLGRNILGTPGLLRGFRSEDARRFTERLYRPASTVFFVRGGIDFRRVTRTVERATADVPSLPAARLRTAPPPYEPRTQVLERDTHQAHVMIGARGYAAGDSRRTALCLLNNLLGGPGMNSRLNVALRERRGLVYDVESSLAAYTDAGVFSVYFGTSASDVERCVDLVRRELRRLRDNRLTTLQLAAAKKQMIGQIGVAGDNAENAALDMGKAFLHRGRAEEPAEVSARIEALTADDLLEAAGEMFDESRLSTLVYR